MTAPLESVAYRLAVVAGHYRWTSDHHEVASAEWREHCWDVRDTERDRVLVSLVSGSTGGRTRVALVDHEHRRSSTFVAGEPMSRSHIGEVCDGYGETIALVRGDGPTGLHLIDPSGRLLALTSRHRGRENSACDLLMMPAGAEVGTGFVLAMSLVIELLRTGVLRRVA